MQVSQLVSQFVREICLTNDGKTERLNLNLVENRGLEPLTSSMPWMKLRVQTQGFESLVVSGCLCLSLGIERHLRDKRATVQHPFS